MSQGWIADQFHSAFGWHDRVGASNPDRSCLARPANYELMWLSIDRPLPENPPLSA